MTEKDNTVDLHIRLPMDVHRTLRHHALDEGISVAEIIRRLVEKYLEKQQLEKQQEEE